MSFLTTTKIIGKRLKVTDYNQYIAELALLAFIGTFYFGFDDLAPIRSGISIAAVQHDDVALMAAPGLYALRLSSFVAMVRRYRMPQTIEWLVFIVVTAVMVVCFAFSGFFVRGYASAHGYRFCYEQGFRAATDVFVRGHGVCPALPADARPY